MSAYYDQGYIRANWCYFIRINILTAIKRENETNFLDNYQNNKTFRHGRKHG